MEGELIYEEESFKIRGAFFQVYKEMGSGFLESVYQECLEMELKKIQIPFQSQPELQLQYKGEKLLRKFVPDLIAFDKIIIEIKAVKNLAPEHRAKLINYLKASNLKLGFLVNFGHYPQVEIERVVT
ncbi:GxxExxY protein [Leptospira meyeri]|uniref:GxxExxY protein n=1 Tax=Leptospira meyeri TaxID=29508 RepID=A0A4R8MML3_LEPME|nr:GxxExxY protein [Leptospira meyeri]EKJ86916.1 GxxExxY protein [Leptospira meyeri serovar Hardjo str. Went 5]TDY67165.1 GxxExxY protein [Leptospira meyeri]